MTKYIKLQDQTENLSKVKDAAKLKKTPRLAVLHYALGRFGGAAKIAILQAKYLNRMGFRAELFYGGPIPEEWKTRIASEMRFSALPLGLPSSLSQIREIVMTLRKLRSFDVIMISYGICPFFAFYMAALLGRKIVWYCGEPLRALWEDYISSESYSTLKHTVKPTSKTLYGNVYSSLFLSKPIYPVAIRFIRTLDQKSARLYGKIIANSQFTKRVIRELYPRNDDIPVVYPGIDLETLGNTKKIDRKSTDFVLAIGALIPMKNHLNLIRAFGKLPPMYRNRTKLIIIGSGPMMPDISSTIRDLGLHNVELKASVTEEELMEHYRNCSFVVHVALYEPFGLVPLEAAIFGKPAVASKIGGPKETVINGETGILVNPLDLIEVSKAMAYLIANQKKAAEMGLKAREMATRQFTMEKSSKNLAAMLRSNT